MTRSVAYAEGSRHTLDIYRPLGAAGAPIVVFFYGGAWRSGYKELYRYVGRALARCGSVAVLPDYDAAVVTYPHVGHFIIVAAFAPLLRFLAPVLRDVDAFIGETLRLSRRW